MANTLILYDGRQSSAERVANAIGYIIGNVRIAEIGESPEEISVYDGFCFIFNFYGALTAGKTKSYLLKNREGLLGKRIAFVGLGFSDAGFTKYVVDMEFAVGGDLSITGMFIKDERTTSEVGYQIAKKLRAPVSVMPAEELSREVDAFVNRHTTMALSTGGGNRIRCTPLEYLYLDGIFYIISEGGLKFSNILDNSNVSAAIFDEYTGNSQPLAGLQMYGVAEQVAVGSDDYWNILAYRGVTEEVLRDLPVTLFVLRIIPMTYEYLNSTFAESGYDARQVLSTRFRAERWESSYASLHAAALKEAQEKAKEKEKSAVQQDKAAEKSENEEPTDNASVDMLIPEEPAETAFVEEETAEPAAQVLSEPEKTAVPEDLSAEPVVEVFPETESAVTEEAEEVFDEADNGTEDETPSVKISEETASEESVDAEIGDFKEETDEKPEETEEIQTTSSVESREISGENLFRNSQIRNEDGSYENINAQKHNMGAEIRKIFQGGGLSFADQLEKQRAEEEGLAPEETEDEKMPMKGIFEEESAYRNSIPRTSSFIEEENTESEEEEKKETYTLEDLERDSKPDEETDKTDSGKKKKFTDLFRKSEREELFDEESFADEFDEIYEEDNEEEIEFEEQPVTRTPKKKKQGGFFATGFGRSIGRFLGISPDMEDEDDEDEDEDEDFDEALEEEDDDFDLSDDDEDLEGAEPGWMVRLRELREDEEVEADDAELYGSGADSGEDTDESSEDSGSEEAAESGEPEESINISSEETGSADVPENDEEPQAEHDAEIDAISKALLQKLEDAEKEAGRDSEISDARSGNDRIGTVSAAADSEYVDEFELEDEEYESARVLERKQETAVSGTGDAETEDESESDEIEESDEEESGKEEPDATENESSLTEIDDASGESESDETGAEPEETDFEIKTESGEVEFEIETESGEVEFEETESEPVEPELEPEEDKSEDDAFEDEFESEDADFEEVSEKDTDLSRHETVDFEEVSDSEKPMVKAASVKDEKKEKKAGTGKKPFEALKKKLFGDLEEEEYDPDDLDDDDLYDGDDDFDDDEFDDRSFITNFTDVLRLAIGGKSGKSKKSRIRLPEKEEKVREDDEELMEVEALISGLAEKEADSENQPEPSDSYEEEPAAEPEESDSYEEEPAEEPEEYPEEETAAPTASESAEPDEEFDVDKYDDSQLDFADDDDSDIIIPGTTRASMSDIVIRGFDDDPLEAETDEDDESDEDDEDDDWEADYRRLKLASLSGKPADYDEAEDDLNEETEVDISVKESEEKDDLYDAYDDDDAYEDDVYDDDDYEDVEWIYEEDDDVADAPFESV